MERVERKKEEILEEFWPSYVLANDDCEIDESDLHGMNGPIVVSKVFFGT